jgi:hypothetical protein
VAGGVWDYFFIAVYRKENFQSQQAAFTVLALGFLVIGWLSVPILNYFD